MSLTRMSRLSGQSTSSTTTNRPIRPNVYFTAGLMSSLRSIQSPVGGSARAAGRPPLVHRRPSPVSSSSSEPSDSAPFGRLAPLQPTDAVEPDQRVAEREHRGGHPAARQRRPLVGETSGEEPGGDRHTRGDQRDEHPISAVPPGPKLLGEEPDRKDHRQPPVGSAELGEAEESQHP